MGCRCILPDVLILAFWDTALFRWPFLSRLPSTGRSALAGLVPVLNGSRITVLRAISGEAARERKARLRGARSGKRPGNDSRHSRRMPRRRGIHLPRLC